MIELVNKKLVFYFEVECANCKNTMNVSHVVINEKEGDLYCALCGKSMMVPDYKKLVDSAEILNSYVGDSMNAKYLNLVLNPNYAFEEEEVAAH